MFSAYSQSKIIKSFGIAQMHRKNLTIAGQPMVWKGTFFKNRQVHFLELHCQDHLKWGEWGFDKKLGRFNYPRSRYECCPLFMSFFPFTEATMCKKAFIFYTKEGVYWQFQCLPKRATYLQQTAHRPSSESHKIQRNCSRFL